MRKAALMAILLSLIPCWSGTVMAQGNADMTGMLNSGFDLLEAGKIDQAQKIYEEVLQKLPRHPLALNNLAAILVKRGDYDQALAYLKQALPQAKGVKVTLNRICTVDGVCAAFKPSEDPFGAEDLEGLIKSNIIMVSMACAERQKKP